MMELYNCDSKAINSKEVIFGVLDDLPTRIGMHKISVPQILTYSGSPDSFDKGGISAFVLIAESHISLHSFNAQRYITADIFSCKEFDVDKVISYFEDIFKPSKIEKKVVSRGVEFPKDIAQSSVVVKRLRHLVK